MIPNSRRLLVVLILGVLGCAPLDSNAPLLVAHSGGVLSQASLDGALLESPAISSESSDSPAPAPDPVPAPALATESLTVSEDSQLPEASTSLSADRGAATASGSDSGEPSLAESEDIGAERAQPDSPSSDAAELPSELSSGEYGGGTVVVQQLSVVDSVAEPREPTEEDSRATSTEPNEAVVATEAGAGDFAPEQSEPPAAEVEGGLIDLASVLPEAPSSDESALAALDSLPRRSRTGSLMETEPCLPGAAGLLAVPLGQLSMVRAWLDGTLLRAELRGPDGRLYTVVRGDRVGSDGGRVLQVSSTQIVVGEIGFGLDGSPFIVQEAIR